MKNISFDNPYWLLAAIPLVLAVLIPFFISMNKDNRNKGWIASLVIHLVIIVCAVLGAADPTHTTVMTRTKIYVVVDVSDSMSRNFDEIDGYIQQIAEAAPQNSKLGIVCFGRDNVILTPSGGEIKSVKEAQVDTSGTNIAAALDFTSTIFSEGELKRIVLITDGCDNVSGGDTISAVERMQSQDIKIDTIYVNSNLSSSDKEVQISDAEYTHSTYLGHETELKLLLEASSESDVIIDLYSKSGNETSYRKLDTTVAVAEQGINVVKFKLPTGVSGDFDYKVQISASEDFSDKNNTYTFTQTVSGMRRVLLVTGKQSDINMMSRVNSLTSI